MIRKLTQKLFINAQTILQKLRQILVTMGKQQCSWNKRVSIQTASYWTKALSIAFYWTGQYLYYICNGLKLRKGSLYDLWSN